MKKHHVTAREYLMHAHEAVGKGNAKMGMKHAFLAIKAMQGKGVPAPDATMGMDDQDGDERMGNQPTSGGVY